MAGVSARRAVGAEVCGVARVDLNPRSLGYEPNLTRHSRQPIPTNTKKIQENRFRVLSSFGVLWCLYTDRLSTPSAPTLHRAAHRYDPDFWVGGCQIRLLIPFDAASSSRGADLSPGILPLGRLGSGREMESHFAATRSVLMNCFACTISAKS